MFFSDQNLSASLLFMTIKSRLIPNYDQERVHNTLTSDDLREALNSARRIDTYLLAREIHEDVCVEISALVLDEVRSYKWIESEKAGRNLWEDHPCEQSQLVAAGKQWVREHWDSFRSAHSCTCAG